MFTVVQIVVCFLLGVGVACGWYLVGEWLSTRDLPRDRYDG
jgi:hypothetical protein